ncbi:phosphoribosyl-AMP cyclohydrolase [Novacetimonas hansenii]|uniref:Phosphoribosyl-AMP cyclohydrolase n=2 Tax=Novacetimonas hansenii TaxID=436 RepID=A0ABQ0SGL4_NOVHA|nr:phosphoribosyl-AMP cyclohydrolase [Novacetimonas hansenii]EFG83829.1 Phosphoribosyl-AMP cyclohydrolase [Novacetimonas hansenii ATCC 23769]GAN83086.1 phosphoribosyl AMP cyclohydrolase [Novacetimonas hansenii JCM 7643]GBQ53765.1 phosphoribosyl-AMP cyclohydrolase [Novacetimonas hansenii NRIC 0243]GEC64516.1 phosphoribosyl-AMP cyclohydrolase [Novacetimonas hansenii]
MAYIPPDTATRTRMIEQVRFNDAGLITAVAQQHDTGEVLMLAWMNADALEETLRTGRVCYFSRSRGTLWRKGETSGQVQTLMDARLDCDRDAVLVLVDQKGVACHTGRRSCFFNAMRPQGLVEISQPLIGAGELYKHKHD